MSLFSFFFFVAWLKFTLNSSRVSPTLSLVKSCVAFDVIRPHTHPDGFFPLLGLRLRSDLCKLASNQHRHHYHLALALGLSLLYISLDWPESLLTDLWSRLVWSLCSSFLWSSVPHDSSAPAQMTEKLAIRLSWRSSPRTAPSEIEHNAKRWS